MAKIYDDTASEETSVSHLPGKTYLDFIGKRDNYRKLKISGEI